MAYSASARRRIAIAAGARSLKNVFSFDVGLSIRAQHLFECDLNSRADVSTYYTGGPFRSSALLRKPLMHSRAGNFRSATRTGRNTEAEAMQLDDRGDHTQA